MNIVVTGSLGHISRPLARELVGKGHSVTVVSSSAARQQQIEALGAAAISGIGGSYRGAIEQAGVNRVVHLSSIGAHTDHGNGLLAFHTHDQESGRHRVQLWRRCQQALGSTARYCRHSWRGYRQAGSEVGGHPR